MLALIRLFHTAVWGIVAGAIFYALYAGHLHAGFYAALGIVLAELAILAVNRRVCPLTQVAARYTEDRSANFDIYLPHWLAANNQRIFVVIVLGGAFARAVKHLFAAARP